MAIEAENMTLNDFKEVVEGLTCRSIPPIVMPEVPMGSFNLTTFPMQEVEDSDNHAVHYIDIIKGHPDDIDYAALTTAYKQACDQKDMQLLPQPFCLKTAPPKESTIQIVILKEEDGTVTIFKHLSFPEKMKICLLKRMVFGEAYKPLFMNTVPKVARKILQYCLENLGGRSFRCFELMSQAMRKPAKATAIPFEDKEDDEIDQGFDHIMQKAPRSSSEMAQLKWQTKELRNKSSPIFGWPIQLVAQALRNLSSDGALARKEYHWPIPLTPKYYELDVLKALEHVWDFDQSAFIMLGEPGSGKSPLGRSVLMAQVRHNQTRFNLQGQPCIRCTPELDFLRGEPGSALMGDFLDDTSLNLLDMKLVKAFLDVGLYESMAWARWGASKWVQNEPRAVADNTYDGDVQLPPDFVREIKFIDFFNMVRPAFKDSATRAHMDAVFKRASFFLNSCTHLYFRAAGINDNHVHRLPMPSEGFLTEAGRKLYGEYKSGSKDPPSGLEEEIRKEQEWISIIMNKKIEERKKNKQEEETRLRIRQALFQEKTPEPDSAISTLEAERAQSVHIKREREEEEKNTAFKKAKAWSIQLAAGHGCVDLDPDDDNDKEKTPPQASHTGRASLPEALENPDWPVDDADEDALGHGGGLDLEE